MRREPYPIAGGTPGLILVSETDDDRRLTAVERVVVETALDGTYLPATPVWRQLAVARVSERKLTGYGAYVELEPFQASVEPDPQLSEDTFAESFVKAPWKPDLLACLHFIAGNGTEPRPGYIGMIECFPIDGEHWSVQEMERLLFGPLDGLLFGSMGAPLLEGNVVALVVELPENNLGIGDRGAVVHVYPGKNDFEVEFVDERGKTKAIVSVPGNQLMRLKMMPQSA